MPIFLLTVMADFGRDTVHEKIVPALLARQASLVLDTIDQVTDEKEIGRPLKTKVVLSLPEDVTREEFAAWVVESIRNEYSGPPFVAMVDRVYEELGP